MSKAKKESVAEIIARRKANNQKKETKTNPAPQKAGVIVEKKAEKQTPKVAKKNTYKKKPKNDIENLLKPETYLSFIRFMATPYNLREQRTQGEFAKEFGVDEGTLSDWKKREGFWDSVREERKLVIKEEMIPKIIMAVYNKTLREGSSKEAKLLLELGGEYEEKRVTENTHTIKELSEERQKEIDDRFKNWFEPDDEEEEEEEEETE